MDTLRNSRDLSIAIDRTADILRKINAAMWWDDPSYLVSAESSVNALLKELKVVIKANKDRPIPTAPRPGA